MIIYCIENTVIGKCYIGQTTQTFKRRKSAHLFDLRSGKHNNKLQSDWDEYGQESFRWYILEDDIDDVYVLTERENKWINKLETHKDDKGYNIACQSYTNVLTDNSRRKQTGAYRIPVVKYSLTGDKLCEYNSITEASNDVGVSLNTMTVCLQGETGKCADFQWRYANDNPPEKIPEYEGMLKQYDVVCKGCGKTIKVPKHKKDKPFCSRKCFLKDKRTPVIQCDLEWNEIKEFDSIYGAYKETNVDRKSILKVLKEPHRMAGGFKWKCKK